jgi:hypothetical protein
MSKKLIAVAAAAALALTSLVGVAPASATTITSVKIQVDDDQLDGGTATVSHVGTTSVSAVTWMSSRTLDLLDSTLTTTRNVIRFEVTTGAATTITVSSTLGVFVVNSLVDSAGAAQKITAGVQSMSGSTISSNLRYTFWAYNNSTTAGKLTISTPGSTNTYNVKGTVGTGYNLSDVKFPTTVTSGVTEADSTAKITFQVTDAYGNQLTAAGAPDSVVVGIFGATVTVPAYNTTRKQYEATVHGTATSSVAMSVTLQAPDLSANGFAKPVTYAFSSVSGASLATQVTNLTAQVATLTAQLAVSRLIEDSVTQDKYNTLARKWNKANPRAKVALKK